MVLIPGGEFVMGDDHGEDDEQPAHVGADRPLPHGCLRGDPGVVPNDDGPKPVEVGRHGQARGSNELVRRHPVLQHAVDPGRLEAVL